VNFDCISQTNPWFVKQKEDHNSILIQVICNVTHHIYITIVEPLDLRKRNS